MEVVEDAQSVECDAFWSEDSDSDDINVHIGDEKPEPKSPPADSPPTSEVGDLFDFSNVLDAKKDRNQLKAGDVDPIFVPTLGGTSIYNVNPDVLAEKPWLQPGNDITDYFNYGFDEVTWNWYRTKQELFGPANIASTKSFIFGCPSSQCLERSTLRAMEHERRERREAPVLPPGVDEPDDICCREYRSSRSRHDDYRNSPSSETRRRPPSRSREDRRRSERPRERPSDADSRSPHRGLGRSSGKRESSHRQRSPRRR